MDVKNTIERFIYLGSLHPVYQKKREGVKAEMRAQLAPLLTGFSGELITEVAKKCLITNKHLVRHDEVWFLYAVYLAHCTQAGDRLLAVLEFPKLALTAEDLFLFAKYALLLREKEGKKGFSKTARKAITYWYLAQNNKKLVELLAVNRGLHGFTHKDLLCLCRVHFTTVDSDVISAMFTKPADTFKSLKNRNDLSTEMDFLRAVSLVKITEDIQVVTALISTFDLKLKHMPMHMLNKAEIWEVLLPTLSYRESFTHMMSLIDSKIMNQKKFRSKFIDKISNNLQLEAAKMHPIEIQIVRGKQESQMRYSETVKRKYYEKKVTRRQLKPNKELTKALSMVLTRSFNHYPRMKLRTCVTINLQKNYEKKRVFGLKQMSCVDASITLALSLFRSEADCKVYAFSNESTTLTDVPWPRDCSYEQAKEICVPLVKEKTRQRIFLPINKATESNEKYDLFVVIVASCARGNPQNKPPTSLMAKYRKVKNKNARFIVINLRRYKPALIHDPATDSGILEICGLDENTPTLINAFATKLFS